MVVPVALPSISTVILKLHSLKVISTLWLVSEEILIILDVVVVVVYDYFFVFQI